MALKIENLHNWNEKFDQRLNEMQKYLFISAIFLNFMAVNTFGVLQNDVKNAPKIEKKIASYAEQVLRFQVLSSALNNDSVYFEISKELDLDDNQKRELGQTLSEYFVKSQSEQVKLNGAAIKAKSENQPSILEESRKDYERLMPSLVGDTEKKLAEILLPHQSNRLKQVSFQMHMSRKHRATGAFVLLPIVESFDSIPLQEKKSFRKKVNQLEKEYKNDLLELRKKYEAAIWNEVSPTVKKELEDRIGGLIYEGQ